MDDRSTLLNPAAALNLPLAARLADNALSQNRNGSTDYGYGIVQTWFASPTPPPEFSFDDANDTHPWEANERHVFDDLTGEASSEGQLLLGDSYGIGVNDRQALKVGSETDPPNLDIAIPSLPPKVFKCSEKRCSTGKLYKTKASLQRHIAKNHSSAYACALDNCRNRAFGSKADLLRHRREIHFQNEGQTPQKFRCPIPSCRRHRVGFPREPNMFSHYQRMHAQSTDKPARRGHLNSTIDQGNDQDEDDSDFEPSARISESSPSEIQSPGRDPTSSSQKLRDELEAMSQEFDTQMETLKREYKTKSETLQRAINLLEKDE